MRKILPLIIVVFVIISYIGCKSTSNPVSPINTNVPFTLTHQFTTTGDTVYFLANPSQTVKVTYIKATWPSGDTASGNFNFTWSKDSLYIAGYYINPPTGIYTFNFQGTLVSGGSSYSTVARDTLR